MRSHAEKRLDARASPAAVERGMALLRDRQALADFIGRLSSTSDAIANSERVAFALGAGDGAAHLVVARDGRGVTTLAAGMAFTWPRVPWPAVEAYLKAQEQLFAAQRALVGLNDVDDELSPLTRYVKYPHRLVRREWDVLRALEPLVGSLYGDGIKTATAEVVFPIALGKHVSDAAGEALWPLYVGGVVSCSLLAEETYADAYLVTAVASGDALLGARALWCLANRPASTLAVLERIAPKLPRDERAKIVVAVLLDAVAFRNPGFARDAHRLARALVPDVELVDGETALRELRKVCAVFLPGLLRRFCADANVISDEAAIERASVADPVDDDACVAAAGGWRLDVWRIWRPLARRHEPPRLVARHPGGVTDADDASVTLWRSFLRHNDQSPLRWPWVGRLTSLAPFEALLPPVDVDPDWKLSEGVTYLQETLPRILRGGDGQPEAKKEPAKAAPKTPPNAPCPCGSGKKFKKCHGR